MKEPSKISRQLHIISVSACLPWGSMGILCLKKVGYPSSQTRYLVKARCSHQVQKKIFQVPLKAVRILTRPSLIISGTVRCNVLWFSRGGYGTITRSKNVLDMFSEEVGCPRIHFVSGITEKVGDESNIIFASGVNDGVSRMDEIEKRALAEALFT